VVAARRGTIVRACAAALAFLGRRSSRRTRRSEYWNHDHFVRVRAAAFDFWQNLQFVVPLAALASIARVAGLAVLARRPRPRVAAVVGAIVLVATPWFRLLLDPEAMVFPPAHYVARTGGGRPAGALVMASGCTSPGRRRGWPLAGGCCIGRPQRGAGNGNGSCCAGGRGADCADPAVGRSSRLVPGRRDQRSGRGLPPRICRCSRWPYRLFAQDWTYPALSVLLHDAPGQAIVVARNDYVSNRRSIRLRDGAAHRGLHRRWRSRRRARAQGLIACVLGPVPRTGAASSTNSQRILRVSRGSMISSIQKVSALRKGERSLFSRSSISAILALGSSPRRCRRDRPPRCRPRAAASPSGPTARHSAS
jgi:hypothetical protein